MSRSVAIGSSAFRHTAGECVYKSQCGDRFIRLSYRQVNKRKDYL